MRDKTLDRLPTAATKQKCWKEYYRKVLDFLKERDKKEAGHNSGYSYCRHGNMRQRRVEVLFSHGDQEAAWELAQGSNISETRWLELAAWRSKNTPQDAAAVLRKLLEEALRPTGVEAYQYVIRLLKTYRYYPKMAGKEEEFTACCERIRLEYARRSLQMKQMDSAKL